MTKTFHDSRRGRVGLKGALALGASSLAVALTSAAIAQDDLAFGDEDAIVVTGSRVRDANLTATSPITTVGALDLSLSNTVNAEQFLNTLPQIIPGNDSSSNNPGIGEATIDLRGLGDFRSLVLVNGRRYVTSNQNPGVVDLNTIPSALVEDVQIITGGASASFGSDAMAGVVNFVLKDDFEGVEFDNSYEISEESDGDIYNSSLTLGSNLADGRGNVTLNVGYTWRDSVFQGDRDGAQTTLVDNGAGAPLGESGSVNVPSTFAFEGFSPRFDLDLDDDGVDDDGVLPSLANVIPSSLYPNYSTALGLPANCDGPGLEPAEFEVTDDDDNVLDTLDFGFCTANSLGFVFNPQGNGVESFVNTGPNTNRYNYAPANYLQIPQERFNIFASGRYDITDNVEAFAQAIFVSSQTEQLLAPTPVFTTVTVNLDNPFLQDDPAALALLSQINADQMRRAVAGDGVPLAFPGEDGILGTDDDVANMVPNPDADGDGVADAQIVTGRRFLETGGRLSDIRNDSFQVQGGLRGTFAQDWSWTVFGSYGEASTAITQTGNINVPVYQSLVASGDANIFDTNGLTPDIVDQIEVLGTITGVTSETVLAGDISGLLGETFASPFADTQIGVTVGAEYRQNTLKTAGSGLGPDIAGFNQAPATSGDFDVYELFLETNVPLVEDKPLIEEIVMTGAFRRSDYSSVGGVNTYAGGLSWTPVPGMRFRGQYQRAVRAPNIGELFQPRVNAFPGLGDPCSGGGNGNWDDLSAAEQTTARANCIANGVPAPAVGTNIQPNGQIEALTGGNTGLSEEVADTYTIGVIWEPTFIDNLRLTVDYYDIEIEDAIEVVPAQTFFDQCFLEGNQDRCDAITRLDNGAVDIFTTDVENIASFAVSGVDMTVDYSYDFGKYGFFNVYSLIGWYDENTFTPGPDSAPIQCVGYYGATCLEPTPEWNINTRFDYSLGQWGARVRWQRISAVEDDLFRNGGEPDLLIEGVDAYNQVDLTGFYTASENLSFSVGIENVFDTDYVIIGDDSAEQSNTYPATYDTIGRTFFGRVTMRF